MSRSAVFDLATGTRMQARNGFGVDTSASEPHPGRRRLREPGALSETGTRLDPDGEGVTLARGASGAEGLYYARAGGRLYSSSVLSDLLATLPVRPGLDRGQLARFFALESPTVGRTHFRGVFEVPAGCRVRLPVGSPPGPRPDPSGLADEPGRLETCGQPPDSAALSDLSPEEAAERLWKALESAAARWTPPDGELGLMLSGGIDSGALAAAAAARFEPAAPAEYAEQAGRRPVAASWIFDELRTCDERERIDAVVESLRLTAVRVSGDDCWPLADPDAYGLEPGHPEENPYRGLKQRLYRRAAEAGVGVLWNGGPADALYRGVQQLLVRDLVRHGHFARAAAAILQIARGRGPRQALGAIGRIGSPAGRMARVASRASRAWLRPGVAASSGSARAPEDGQDTGARARLVRPYLDLERRGLPIEAVHASHAGVRVVSPYLDPDLVELLLALPSFLIARPGCAKDLMRRAMTSRLPDAVVRNQTTANLSPLFDRGVFERESGPIAELLGRRRAVWPEFVRPEAVEAVGPRSSEAEKALLWRCASFELWRGRHGWELA